MNDNTSYREKGRAVFLAAIMVLSVVAMSAAFAGSAAANAGTPSIADNSDDLGEDPGFANIEVSHNSDADDVAIAIGDTSSSSADIFANVSDISEYSEVDLVEDGIADGSSETVFRVELSSLSDGTYYVGSNATDDGDGDVISVEDSEHSEIGQWEDEGDEILTVHDAEYTIDSIDADAEVETSSTTDITVNVENEGDVQGADQTIDLGIFEFPDDTTDVYTTDVDAGVAPGDTDSVEFNDFPTPSDDGTHYLSAQTEDTSWDDYGFDSIEVEEEVEEEGETGDVDFEPDRPWQGQDVVASGEDIEYDTSYDLRLVEDTDDGVVSSTDFIEELTAGNNGTDDVVNISTDDLEQGDYYLSGGDLPRYPDSDAVFEVRTQDFDADFDDDSVTDAGPDAETEVEFDSNRGDYSVNISADGDLDDEELFAIFVDEEADQNVFDGYDNISEVIEGDSVENASYDGVTTNFQADLDDIDSVEDYAATYRALSDAAAEAGLDYWGVSADDADAAAEGSASDAGEAGYDYFGDMNIALFLEGQDDDDADYDEKVVALDVDDDDYVADFDGINDDEYTFDFHISDTAASSSADITVYEHDAEMDFDQSVYTQTAGDPVHLTIDLEDTDDGYLVFGSEDDAYVDIIYVEDDTDNGEVDITLNPRLMSTGSPYAVVSSDDEVISLVDDIDDLDSSSDAEDYFGDLTLWDDYGDGTPSNDAFADALYDMDLIDDDASDGVHEHYAGDNPGLYQLIRPMQATDYPLATSASAAITVDDDDELDIDDEADAAVLDLTQPSLGELETLVAPENSADEHNLAELLSDDDDEATITPRTDIAEDDRLIVRAEANGIYGVMVQMANEGDYDPLTEDGFSPGVISDLEDEGVTIEIEQDDAPANQDPNAVDFDGADDDAVWVYGDHINGELYIVVDTSDDSAFDRSYEDGDTFEASIEYEADEDDRSHFSYANSWEVGVSDDNEEFDGTQNDGYPYFQADTEESVSVEFDMVDRAVEFDNLDADDNVQIEASEEAVLTGETNVAPGTEAALRVTNAGDTPSFLSTEDAEISSDGTFESETFDFSDRDVDDEAEIDFRAGGDSIDDFDGIFVEEVEEEDDEPVDADDDEPVDTDDDEPVDTDDDEPVDTDDDPAPTADDTADDTEDDGVPGFGLAIAVVALLAAAMLALRRQN